MLIVRGADSALVVCLFVCLRLQIDWWRQTLINFTRGWYGAVRSLSLISDVCELGDRLLFGSRQFSGYLFGLLVAPLPSFSWIHFISKLASMHSILNIRLYRPPERKFTSCRLSTYCSSRLDSTSTPAAVFVSIVVAFESALVLWRIGYFAVCSIVWLCMLNDKFVGYWFGNILLHYFPDIPPGLFCVLYCISFDVFCDLSVFSPLKRLVPWVEWGFFSLLNLYRIFGTLCLRCRFLRFRYATVLPFLS